jgi:hypothetical protein
MDTLAAHEDLLRAARYRERAREAEALAATAHLPEARHAYAELANWWIAQERRSWLPPVNSPARYNA